MTALVEETVEDRQGRVTVGFVTDPRVIFVLSQDDPFQAVVVTSKAALRHIARVAAAAADAVDEQRVEERRRWKREDPQIEEGESCSA